MDAEAGVAAAGGASFAWMNRWMAAEDDPGISNYSEDHKLMEGPLIKIGDYAHFRYFLLFRNGRLCYYELPIPAGSASVARRVHVTLTSQHLRGVMMLNASSSSGKDMAKTEAEYEAELIKRGMIFNRRKLELSVSGYSPTGQLMSWKLRASGDATYVKWERALRLALRPIWVQNTPACLICQQNFSFLLRPHHCRKCGTCMCDDCSTFVPRLPMQGYYADVRICRDCSPIKIQQSALRPGTRVLVYGIYVARVMLVISAQESSDGLAQVDVVYEPKVKPGMQQLQKQKQRRPSLTGSLKRRPSQTQMIMSSDDVRRVRMQYVELYSEAVLSANRIKNALRLHLSYTLFRTQLNFSTWNLLETVQEQKTVQMVRILNKSASINELRSMVPSLSSLEAMHFATEDADEDEQVRASLALYRGVHVVFPLRLDTVLKLIDQFRNGIVLHRVYVYQILDEVEKLMRQANGSPMNTIKLPAGVRVVVVGDLHGQLEDLLTIFEKCGLPSAKTWFLFNGDFVDRGSHGVEVMITLLTLKLLYPTYVFLNRGNHEERMINEVFGFEDEVFIKYNPENDERTGWTGLGSSTKYSPNKIFQMFETIFTILPIFTLMNDSVLIMHGGLSNLEDVSIEEMTQIDHQREIPTQGSSREDILFTHLLWSDPRAANGSKPSDRGAGVEFGPDITRRFCTDNGINLIIRSHECQEEGYEIIHDGLLLTIFSASNYCGSQTNKGAYVQLEIQEDGTIKPHVVQYYAQPLQKLRDAAPNEWRQKARRLERRTLISLMELICEKKSTLLAYYHQMDTRNTGRITKLQWKEGLTHALGMEVNFLSYFSQLATLENDSRGGIDYKLFLQRYSVELDSNNIDWKQNRVQQLWMAFCKELATGKSDVDEKIDMQQKLRAAFDLFQLNASPPPLDGGDVSAPVDPVVQTNGNGNQNGSSRSLDAQRTNAQYMQRGLVTYDVFRVTLQHKLALDETLSEQQIFELMQRMDQNHDGFVDFQEFCSFFAEFSRLDYLQELFEVKDAKAIQILNRFGSELQRTNQFSSLQQAFRSFDRDGRDKLDVDDIIAASESLQMTPALELEDAKLLYDAVLRSYYGVKLEHEWEERGLDWTVFEDVFSPDSTRQRSMWMTSLRASNTSLAALASTDGNDDSNVTWADTLVDIAKHALHEQRLYIKLIFRMLDHHRHGYISKRKFIGAMSAINEEHGSPMNKTEIEQLADAFACFPPNRRRATSTATNGQTNGQAADDACVEYPRFLRSLRVIVAECKSQSQFR